MIGETDELVVMILPTTRRRRREFRLMRPLHYRGCRVPAGFVTDMASTPRWAWSILPPFGRYERAAVLHDYHYASHNVTRLEADRALRRNMKADGVGTLARNLIYWSVRLFGGHGWRRRDAS